jgi:hypothetical protein
MPFSFGSPETLKVTTGFFFETLNCGVTLTLVAADAPDAVRNNPDIAMKTTSFFIYTPI